MLLALNDSTLGVNSFAQFFTVLIIFAFVLALCYFTTRYVAGYQKGKMLSGNINVVETFRIANNKYIQIIKIGDKYFAVCYAKDSVCLLGELNEESLNLKAVTDEVPTPYSDFKTILNKAKSGKPEASDGSSSELFEKDEDES